MGTNYSTTHWRPDEECPKCEKCEKEFSMTRRRHHCRNCGGVFCADCCFRKAAVPGRNIKQPVLLCDSCFVKIVQRGAPGQDENNKPAPTTTNGAVTNLPPSTSPMPDRDSTAATSQVVERCEFVIRKMALLDIAQIARETNSCLEEEFVSSIALNVQAEDPNASLIPFPDGNDGNEETLLNLAECFALAGAPSNEIADLHAHVLQVITNELHRMRKIDTVIPFDTLDTTN